MLELVLDDASSFKKCVDAIAVLIDEAEFVVGENGLELKATDPSQIAMVDFEMKKTSFDEYEVEEETRICVSLKELLKLLRRAGKDDKWNSKKTSQGRTVSEKI